MTTDPWTCLRWARAQTCSQDPANPDPNAKYVLLTVATYAGYNTDTDEWACTPGQKLLARDTGMGDRTVRRHLAELERLGLITRTARFRPEGRGRTSDRIVLRVSEDQPARTAAMPPDQPASSDTTNRPAVQDQPATGGRAEVPENLPVNARAPLTPEERRVAAREACQDRAQTIAAIRWGVTDPESPRVAGLRAAFFRDHGEVLMALADDGCTHQQLVQRLIMEAEPAEVALNTPRPQLRAVEDIVADDPDDVPPAHEKVRGLIEHLTDNARRAREDRDGG